MTRPMNILVVDDNPADLDLTRETFRDTEIPYQLYAARDGVEALDYLRQCGTREKPRPDLILLDLNMPRMDGRELLATIKQDPALRRIPVVVLTTSRAEPDIVNSYDLHANCYVTKPVDFDQFAQVVRSIQSFWLRNVELSPA